jgi:exodeoxyribonuclease III
MNSCRKSISSHSRKPQQRGATQPNVTHHLPESQWHPQRLEQKRASLGSRAGAGCRLPAGTQGAIARPDAGNACAGGDARLLPCCRKEGLQRRRPLASQGKPDRVVEGFDGGEFDAEGRYIRADFGRLSVISLYLPSGSSSPERQEAKFRFLEAFLPHLAALRAEGREVVLCGDWNIAHKEIDLRNWKSNQKNSGFLPEERAWLSTVFDEQGWVDVYRQLHPEATGDSYTWWSNRGQAWAKNVGWRIDYQIATPGLAGAARRAEIYKASAFPTTRRWSSIMNGPAELLSLPERDNL